MSEPMSCPNPWCASHQPHAPDKPFIERLRAAGRYQVCCPHCPLKGPLGEDREQAVVGWNTRSITMPETASDRHNRLTREIIFLMMKDGDRLASESDTMVILESVVLGVLLAYRPGDPRAQTTFLEVMSEAIIGRINA